jgi:hypothetical protein
VHTGKKRLAADFTGRETDNAKLEEQFESVLQAISKKSFWLDCPIWLESLKNKLVG